MDELNFLNSGVHAKTAFSAFFMGGKRRLKSNSYRCKNEERYDYQVRMMIKKLTYLRFVVLLAVISQAAGDTLKVDFNGNNWGDVIIHTQDEFEAYNARNEAGSDFVPVDYSAFGTIVTVIPTWTTGAADAGR